MFDRIRLRTFCLVFAVVGILPYLGALWAGFVFDDVDAVVGNPLVNGDIDFNLSSLFMRDFWGLPSSESIGSYRPLAVLSFALDYRLGGGAAWVCHLSNLLFHGATCAALMAVLASRFDRRLAACATLFFAIHALHTENVVSLVARADVLATLFVLGTLWLAREDNKYSWLAGVSLFLGLLAKETAVAAIAIVLGEVVLGFTRDYEFRRRLYALAAMCVAFGVYMVLRYAAMDMISAPVHLPGNPLVEVGGKERIYTAAALLYKSTHMMLLPLDLAADYSYPALLPHRQLLSVPVLVGMGLWLSLPIGMWYFRKRDPAIAWGLAIVLAGYFPISNVIVLVPTIFAERLLYLPSVGWAIVWGRLLCRGYDRLAGSPSRSLKHVFVALLVAYSLFHGARSLLRTADWETNRSLFTADITSPPAGLLTHFQLGRIEREAGNLEASAGYFNHAIEVAPRYGVGYAGLGLTLDLLGSPESAHRVLQTSLQVTPDCISCYTAIISFYLKYGRFEAAEALLRRLETIPKGQGEAERLWTTWHQFKAKLQSQL